MRSQVRLRVLLPVVAVAIAGLLFVKFGFSALGLGPDTGEPVAASAVGSASPSSPKGETETTGQAETTPAPAEQPSPEPPVAFSGIAQLETELEAHKVVVLVVYSPESSVDSLVMSEARLGASDVKAGFLAVNAHKEKLVGDLALEYGVRETPAVLVFRRGPELKTNLIGFADRQTVAQAAQDARRG